jgi:hypothetical protein
MPAPNHPPTIAELAALNAVSVVVDFSTGDGDRHRAELLHLILIDFRAFRSATRR